MVKWTELYPLTDRLSEVGRYETLCCQLQGWIQTGGEASWDRIIAVNIPMVFFRHSLLIQFSRF